MMMPSVPTLYIGPPGVGKTARVAADAEEWKLPLITLHLAECDPLEISGGHVPDDSRRVLVRYPPDWWLQACDQPAVILLDELTAAAPEQRVAGLRVADDSRTLGGKTLHAKTVIFATANPPEYAAGSRAPLTAPELSRWRIRRVDAIPAIRWLAGHPGAIGEVGRFCRACPAHALASPEAMKTAVAEQCPFPTPRGWHRTAGLPDDEAAEIVGMDAVAGFAAWRAANDLPDPIEILAGRERRVPLTGDGALATACAVAGLLAARERATDKAIECGLRWFGLAADAGHAGTVAAELREIARVHMAAVTNAMGDVLAPYQAMLHRAGAL